jgi:hypothetical protein
MSIGTISETPCRQFSQLSSSLSRTSAHFHPWTAQELTVACSIAYGVIGGIATYLLLNGVPWALRKVSGDRIVPSYYGNAEPWTPPPGGIVPGWMLVLLVPLDCVCRLKSFLGNPLEVMSPIVVNRHDRTSLLLSLPHIQPLPSINHSRPKKSPTFQRTIAQSISLRPQRGIEMLVIFFVN